MDPTPVPFVDLRLQYKNLQSEVTPAMEDVIANAQFIMGPQLQEFEDAFSRYVGSRHTIGVESGTAALSVGMKALGIGDGDEVILPANTYIASAIAVSQVGATPVFVDIDDNYLIDQNAIEGAITPRTRAIMPVHLYGQAVPMDGVMQLARSRNLFVVEDASQAHGAKYQGRRVGSFGDIGCFSFYPGKNLGCYGDGGAIVTNDDDVASKIRLFRDFGQKKKYEHLILGDNCRLDTLQAAVLSVKLRYIDAWNEARRKAARTYDSLLSSAGFPPPPCLPAEEGHVYHLYVVQVEDREGVQRRLARENIQSGIHYPIPIHLQPAYAHLNLRRGRYPKTEAAAEKILSLPMFPEITTEQVERVVHVLLNEVAAPA